MAAADTLADAALELTIANLRASAGQNQEIQALLEDLEAGKISADDAMRLLRGEEE